MKALTITTATEDGFKSENRYRGTYLHGKLETDFGYDIFSFDRKQDFDQGIHNFTLNVDGKEQDVTFFLWKNEHYTIRMEPWRGLMVYTKDTEYYEDALEKYKIQTDFL